MVFRNALLNRKEYIENFSSLFIHTHSLLRTLFFRYRSKNIENFIKYSINITSINLTMIRIKLPIQNVHTVKYKIYGIYTIYIIHQNNTDI